MLACLTSTLLKTNTTQPANEFDFCTRPRSAPRPMALIKFAEIALLMWQAGWGLTCYVVFVVVSCCFNRSTRAKTHTHTHMHDS